MPLSNYDQYCGSKGCAQKMYDAMISQYGEQRGKSVFYAKIATLKKAKGKNGSN